jgi:hypothetical protein
MKILFFFILFVALGRIIFPLAGYGQNSKDSTSHLPPSGNGLFETNDPLLITISGNTKELLNDRGDNSRYHNMLIKYQAADSTEISIPVDIKTRGHFRKQKENCFYPPLLLHFSKSPAVKNSLFKDNHKLKLVMPCRGDQFVVHEWLVYRIYNLFTTKSFRGRLVRVRIENPGSRKSAPSFFGMLLEEEEQMASRNGAIPVRRKLNPVQTETNSFLTMAVFEYLIGNTDWSIQFQQNIKLIAEDSSAVPTPVPYDFDMSGFVNSPYGKPAEELELGSVRERRYRGYCLHDMKKFDEVFALFNRLKPDIYGLILNCSMLDPKYINSTIKFFDDFYTTINNPAKAQKEFRYPCNQSGTGNIIIKGLKKD